MNLTDYTRLHLIEQIMVIRGPRAARAYRSRLERAPLARLRRLHQLLTDLP
jgi:hypothetical protein